MARKVPRALSCSVLGSVGLLACPIRKSATRSSASARPWAGEGQAQVGEPGRYLNLLPADVVLMREVPVIGRVGQ